MLEDMLFCPKHFTTYRLDYVGRENLYPRKVFEKPPQEDEALIANHCWRNLQVNGHKLKSKVFPKSVLCIEEYRDYVKRLECCKKEIHKLYYRCPNMNIPLIEKLLKELELTTYQHAYSPNSYCPRDNRRYLDQLPKANLKYYETTYGTYYNRIKELERFKFAMYKMLSDKDKSLIEHERNRFYLTGYSVYHATYCIPGIENSKKFNLRDGPIDRYTLRRV